MIKVYTKNGCIACKMSKKFLKQNNIKFEEVNIDEDEIAFVYLKKKGIMSVPYIETSNGQNWSGFRLDKLRNLVKSK